MATIYEPAPEVAETAVSLIAEHHQNLLGAPIVYLFMDPAPKSKGRLVLGRARKLSGLNAFLVALAAGEVDDPEEDHSFFVMEIAKDEWDGSTPQQRVALVDHELCHFAVDEDGVLGIRGHDLEEFDAVVRRHGLWRDDVQRFADACASSCVVVS